MLERLAGENGTIDPERFAAMRERICTAPDAPLQAAPEGQGERPANAGPADAGAARNRGSPRGGVNPFARGGGNRGRWFANATYRLELDNTVLIAPGITPLDLLDGDAIGGTGEPRHSVRFRSGIFYGGFGAFVFGTYTGQSTLDGSGLPGSTDLTFDDFVSINLRTFVDFDQKEKLIERIPLLDKTRLIFRIDNIFDARQRVTDSNGDVPLRYQPFLQDPVGRRFEVGLRKLF